MMLKRWFNLHGLLALLGVLLAMACVTTIAAAHSVSAASKLQTRTQQLTDRVAAEKDEAEPATSDEGNRASHRGRRGNQEPPDPNNPAAVAAQRIAARSLFTNPPQPQFRKVIGVLGDAALYEGGRMLWLGEQMDGATLKTVGPDYVEFDYEGQSVRVDVQAGNGGGGPPGNGPSGPRGGPGGGPMSDEDRAAMRQRMQERFGNGQNLTPEQIEELRAQFRARRNGGGNNNGGGQSGGNQD